MEIIGQELPALCGKAEAYRVLDRAGLNTPPWFQMDLDEFPLATLFVLEKSVRTVCDKTGYTGFRVDKKSDASKLGRYPHVIQRGHLTPEVLLRVRDNLGAELEGFSPSRYALIINSAFTAYDWHAVVKISSNPEHYDTTSHQEYPLEGEVSLKYDWSEEKRFYQGITVIGTAVLRHAMKHWPIQIPRRNRRGTETILPSPFQRLIPTLRDMLLRSCVIDRYVECSGVRYGHEFREKEIICWGLR